MDVYTQSRFISRNKPYSRKTSPTRRDSRRDNSFRKTSSRKDIPEDQCMSLFPIGETNTDRKQKQNGNEWINKTPNNNRLTSIKERRQRTWQQENGDDKQDVLLSTEEFPALGENVFQSNYTPEGSKDWGSLVEEEEERKLCGQYEPPRYKRRLVLAESQRDNTVGHTERKSTERPMMTDEHKLKQRQKQLDFGKNTVAYGRFCKATPRAHRSKEGPWTPDKYQVCSTRSWVGQIKLWRRALHVYDPPQEHCQEIFLTSSQSTELSTEGTETKMEVDSVETSSTQSSSTDDMFRDFDLDSCLLNDGLPL